MLVLLPPSETKVSGGGSSFEVDSLAFSSLLPLRERMITALEALAVDEEAAARVLKVGPKSRHEITANANLRVGPAMPAIERYTGVLFDGLEATTLDADARGWVDQHVAIHSAPFGPVMAGDEIPAYRLAAGISVPGVGSQRSLWASAVTRVLSETHGIILDLRSKGYQHLGPVAHAIAPHVVTETPDGEVRALNHFNKNAKGALVRKLAQWRPALSTLDELIEWSDTVGAGLRMRDGAAQLVHAE